MVLGVVGPISGVFALIHKLPLYRFKESLDYWYQENKSCPPKLLLLVHFGALKPASLIDCLKIEKITDFWIWIEGFPGAPFWRRLDSIRTLLNWRIINDDGTIPISFPDNLGDCSNFITDTEAGRAIFFDGDHYIEADDPGLKFTVTEWWNNNQDKIVN